MHTDKCIKWLSESVDFFKYAENDSLVLDLLVPHAENVINNTLEKMFEFFNSPDIRKKIKLLRILDTSYLYRHIVPEFSQYCDLRIPTKWYLANKHLLEKLDVNFKMLNWFSEITKEPFRQCYQKIIIDYEGDLNHIGINQGFRDIVLIDAAVASNKENYNVQNYVDFILEKCAYACMAFKEHVNLITPLKISKHLLNIVERYNLNIQYLRHKIIQPVRSIKCDFDVRVDNIDREVASFMQEKATNINFFVIDKYGNHIYKNNSNNYETNIDALTSIKDVMATKKQIITQNTYGKNSYLSFKSPLIINQNVEGVIGLSLDITDQKRAEELELQNKLQQLRIRDQEEFRMFISQIAHDIVSPVIGLEYIMNECNDLHKDQRLKLNVAINNIKNISQTLLNKYKQDTNDDCARQTQHIFVSLAIRDVVEQKKYEYKHSKIQFIYSHESKFDFAFIQGDQYNFSRMLSNLINNAAESIEDQTGIVEITFAVRDNYVKITIKDTGKGMSQHMANNIMRNENIHTTKPNGNGLGLKQAWNTIKLYDGNINIVSKIDCGTTVAIQFPKCEKPTWITNSINLKAGTTIVVIDDDTTTHNIFKTKFLPYLTDVFVNFFTNSSDAMKFIDCYRACGCTNLFMIADYDLKEEITGLQCILEASMQQSSLLITSVHNDKIRRDLAASSGVKMFPKQFLSEIKVALS